MKWQGSTLERQPLSYSYSPSDGYTFERSFEGTPSAIYAVAKLYKQLRIPFSVRNEGPKANLEARHQAPEDGEIETPNGSWGITGNPETVDWRQHDKFLALSEDTQAFIQDRIDGKIDFSPSEVIAGVVWDSDSTFQLDPVTDADALFFYGLACKNQLHFDRVNWTLRHSMTVSQSYTANLIGDNIDRVYTKAQLLSECASFDDPLPPRYVAQINAIVFNPAAVTGYVAGWLKHLAADETVAGERCQCSVEYILQLWPTIFYPAL